MSGSQDSSNLHKLINLSFVFSVLDFSPCGCIYSPKIVEKIIPSSEVLFYFISIIPYLLLNKYLIRISPDS